MTNHPWPQDWFIPYETPVGYASGRDAIFLDDYRADGDQRTLTIIGDFNGRLVTQQVDTWIAYTMTFVRVSAWMGVSIDDGVPGWASSLDRVTVPIQGPSSPVPADPVAAIAYPHGYAHVYHLDDPPDPALVIYQLMTYETIFYVACHDVQVTVGARRRRSKRPLWREQGRRKPPKRGR